MSDAVSRLVREANGSGGEGNQVLTQFFFERFLSRVFAENDTGQWMLAGGTSMLARVATARATKDIDLINTEASLEFAERELVHIAARDLGDFVNFEFFDRKPSVGADSQPYAKGVTMRFTCRIGAKFNTKIRVDLVVRPQVTGTPVLQFPENRIELNKPLKSCAYVLFPVIDQVADKLCASQQKYGSGADSSREKDFVDLAVLACTQTMEARELARAISVEAARRKMGRMSNVSFPSGWKPYIEKEAQKNPVLNNVSKFEQAVNLMDEWLLPVLVEKVQQHSWDYVALKWVQ